MYRSRSPRRKRAFTLVELLVVLAIIAVLIAMLLPALRKAKEGANAAKCSANLRTIMQGALMFAQDYNNHLPGNDGDRGRQLWWQRDFLFGPPQGVPVVTGLRDAPKSGTLWRYVKNAELYKCPSNEGAGEALTGGLATTNQRFDYGMFKSLAGAKIGKIKTTCRFRPERSNAQPQYGLPTPVFCQELAGTVNGTNPEGGHSNEDAMSIIHGGGSYYATLDGSVHYFQEGFYGSKKGVRSDYFGVRVARFWQQPCPINGLYKDIGKPNGQWGEWQSIASNGSQYGW